MTSRWPPALTVAGVTTFIGLTAASALAYPGGHAHDPHARGYSLASNYWCDLYRERAWNGEPHAAASWALAGSVAAVIAVGAGLFTASSWPGASPRLRRAARALVAIACLAMPLVPFVPADRYGRLHFLIIGVAALPALAALGLTSWIVCRSERARRDSPAAASPLATLTAVVVVASGLHFVHYLAELVGGAALGAGIPLEQKIVTALELSWLLAIARTASRSAR